MDTTPDFRTALRQQMRQRRMALSAAERIAAADALAAHLRALPQLQQKAYVAGYWAVQGEIALHALLSPAPAFVYCLPCLAPGQQLRFAPWCFGDALVQNRFGIPEPDLAPESQLMPQDLDVVLVPLLAFDARGARLGSGGGFYDRSFAFLHGLARPARPLLIGVAHAFQQVEHLPDETWDVALDLVVTDAGVIHCGTAA